MNTIKTWRPAYDHGDEENRLISEYGEQIFTYDGELHYRPERLGPSRKIDSIHDILDGKDVLERQ